MNYTYYLTSLLYLIVIARAGCVAICVGYVTGLVTLVNFRKRLSISTQNKKLYFKCIFIGSAMLIFHALYINIMCIFLYIVLILIMYKKPYVFHGLLLYINNITLLKTVKIIIFILSNSLLVNIYIGLPKEEQISIIILLISCFIEYSPYVKKTLIDFFTYIKNNKLQYIASIIFNRLYIYSIITFIIALLILIDIEAMNKIIIPVFSKSFILNLICNSFIADFFILMLPYSGPSMSSGSGGSGGPGGSGGSGGSGGPGGPGGPGVPIGQSSGSNKESGSNTGSNSGSGENALPDSKDPNDFDPLVPVDFIAYERQLNQRISTKLRIQNIRNIDDMTSRQIYHEYWNSYNNGSAAFNWEEKKFIDRRLNTLASAPYSYPVRYSSYVTKAGKYRAIMNNKANYTYCSEAVSSRNFNLIFRDTWSDRNWPNRQ